MADTLATVNFFLKENYKPGLNKQINNMKSIYRRIDKNCDDWAVHGKSLIALLPTLSKRNHGYGWRGEGDALPAAKQLVGVQAQVGLAYNFGSIELTQQSIKAAEKDSDSLARTVDLEIEHMREGMEVDINRGLAGRATGALAKITAPSATPQGANVLFEVDDVSRLEEGMVVEMFSTDAGSGGAQTAGTPEISMVDRVNNRIAFVAAQNIVQGDFLYMQGTRGKSMMGFEGCIDGFDSTGALILNTFQNIDRTTSIYYQGNVIDNGGVDIALNLVDIQRAFEMGEIRVGGTCSLIYSDYTSKNAYREILSADKRYVGTLDLDGGWSALEYTGGGSSVPWVADRHCKPKRIFFVDEKTFCVFHLSKSGPVEWDDTGGSILKWKQGFAAYVGFAYMYLQLGCLKPAANTVLRDRVAA